MNILVLCGGLCPEREVSISSGMGIAQALRARGHRAVAVDVFFGYAGDYQSPADIFLPPREERQLTIGTDVPDLTKIRAGRTQKNDSKIGDNVVELCLAADMVFMALHGEEGENGKLQATFDIYGIKYTGSGYLGSALAMHKGVSKDLLAMYGIKAPRGCMVKRGGSPPEDVPLPCVVKPCSGGSSVGTSIVHNAGALADAMAEAFRYENTVILEEYIAGREFSVGVIDGRALPVIEICPKTGFYDYRNKYQSGRTDEYCPAALPANVTAAMQKEAERVFEILMMEVYGRVDFMMDSDGEIYCLEANTLPGMTPLSLIPKEAAAAGMDFGALCEEIIQLSMEKYQWI